MMNLFQGASDDQLALMGCFVALVGSMFLMYISFFVGPASRKKPEVINPDSTQSSSHPKIELSAEAKRGRAA